MFMVVMIRRIAALPNFAKATRSTDLFGTLDLPSATSGASNEPSRQKT
jgi:hypothetical protein